MFIADAGSREKLLGADRNVDENLFFCDVRVDLRERFTKASISTLLRAATSIW